MEETRLYVEILGYGIDYFKWEESDIYLPMSIRPLQSDTEGDHLLAIL